MAPMAPEAAVSRAYVEWLLDLPWGKRTKDQLEIDRARRILDEDHHGLEKVKERILEFIAVLRTANELKGPILCLVGPPGVGKTSLGRSIARALGRKFVRVSLGGVRDEAEIRGHRRTYIGSLPGRIIQCLKKAGSENPVFLLDEIDKLGLDYRGDPASALLEVLDPEQNKAFNDHYLEVDYDLSRVLFIATANSAAGAPPALLDRMEIIQLSGYTSQEKRKIAEAFLIPKQIKAHGLRRAAIAIPDETVSMLIEGYTREAGVRQLEREIAALCRKAARERAETGAAGKMTLGPDKARALLGRPRFSPLRHESEPEVGVATGLAWTETGGELLPVETTTMPGEGKLELTGQLGSVMQESAKAALSYIRSRAARFGLDPQFHKTLDLHVHIPEGAIPKDGPSAGVALLVSMASALTGRPARRDIAMTGEITLRGKALKIGGFKEKALAAHRSKIARVIAPEDNRADLEDLPQEALREIDFAFIENVETALDLLLEPEKKPE
ncbi:MAG: Lon protease [candidate division BRC1 bacterium ADurb.BinA364]|nr:MAG: Lon protease [candidate division BRC1 bacterium ADurb.BinA364]